MPRWGKGHSFHRPHDCGGSDGCGRSVATRSCRSTTAVRAAGHDPASDALGARSRPAASWHQPIARHGGDKPANQKFKAYPIGNFHIDIAEVRTEEGKLHLYVGIDRTSKLASLNSMKRQIGRPRLFLEALIEAVLYHLHTILADNGIQFADLPRNRDGWTARCRVHRFGQICREHSIEHRLTKPNHPWTSGQVERMNRTIKDATVKTVTLR
jgi:IS30 family transposase